MSGTETLPTGWAASRLALISTVIQTGPFGSQLHAEDYVDGGVPMINPLHIRDGRLEPSSSTSVSVDTAQRLGRHRFRLGDVVFARRGELGRCAAIGPEAEGWLCGTGSMILRPNPFLASGDYVQLAASLPHAREWLSLSSVGSTMENLNASILGRLPLLLPPRDAQDRIVRYVQRSAGQFDSLITKKERLIELLQEKRQALITQAVTKGIDPSVPMKDSGVEWLGQIPAHWHALPLRRLVSRIEQGWSPTCDSRPAEPGEWGVLKAGCTANGVYRPGENKALLAGDEPRAAIEVRPGDLIMSRASGSRHIVGSCAIVSPSESRLMLSDKHFRLFASSHSTTTDFVWLALASRPSRVQIELNTSGAEGLANNLPQSELLNVVIATPPLFEQSRLVRETVSRLRALDDSSAALSLSLDRLREYRQALISAAVTGKIDVTKRGNHEHAEAH